MKASVYIADANILIDLLDLQLGELWTSHFKCFTSVEVFNELVLEGSPDDHAWLFDPDSVEVRSLDEDKLSQAASIREAHPALSFPDCTVVVLARSESLIVLSGDGPMRKKAATLSIEVHGLLYVLDQLVQIGALPGKEAVQLCRRWQMINPRTPQKLCDKYCADWEARRSND